MWREKAWCELQSRAISSRTYVSEILPKKLTGKKGSDDDFREFLGKILSSVVVWSPLETQDSRLSSSVSFETWLGPPHWPCLPARATVGTSLAPTQGDIFVYLDEAQGTASSKQWFHAICASYYHFLNAIWKKTQIKGAKSTQTIWYPGWHLYVQELSHFWRSLPALSRLKGGLIGKCWSEKNQFLVKASLGHWQTPSESHEPQTWSLTSRNLSNFAFKVAGAWAVASKSIGFVWALFWTSLSAVASWSACCWATDIRDFNSVSLSLQYRISAAFASSLWRSKSQAWSDLSSAWRRSFSAVDSKTASFSTNSSWDTFICHQSWWIFMKSSFSFSAAFRWLRSRFSVSARSSQPRSRIFRISCSMSWASCCQALLRPLDPQRAWDCNSWISTLIPESSASSSSISEACCSRSDRLRFWNSSRNCSKASRSWSLCFCCSSSHALIICFFPALNCWRVFSCSALSCWSFLTKLKTLSQCCAETRTGLPMAPVLRAILLACCKLPWLRDCHSWEYILTPAGCRAEQAGVQNAMSIPSPEF